MEKAGMYDEKKKGDKKKEGDKMKEGDRPPRDAPQLMAKMVEYIAF